MLKILEEKVTIKEGSKERKVTKQEVLSRAMVQKAAKGCPTTFKLVQKILEPALAARQDPYKTPFTWGDVLRSAQAEMAKRAAQEATKHKTDESEKVSNDENEKTVS